LLFLFFHIPFSILKESVCPFLGISWSYPVLWHTAISKEAKPGMAVNVRCNPACILWFEFEIKSTSMVTDSGPTYQNSSARA
jgi:hypothetical protein